MGVVRDVYRKITDTARSVYREIGPLPAFLAAGFVAAKLVSSPVEEGPVQQLPPNIYDIEGKDVIVNGYTRSGRGEFVIILLDEGNPNLRVSDRLTEPESRYRSELITFGGTIRVGDLRK